MIPEEEGGDLMSGVNHQKLHLVNMSTRGQRRAIPASTAPKVTVEGNVK